MSKKIQDEDLIDNLKELSRKLGRVPRKNDVQINNGSKYGSSSYVRAFGTFGRALIAADIKPHQVRALSKKEIIDDLRKVYNKLGRTPTHYEYVQEGGIYSGFSSIVKRFGSWTKALIEADIPVVSARKVDQEFIMIELRKWYSKNNCNTNCLSYWTIRNAKKDKIFPFSCNTIRKHFFGISWEEIMRNIDPLYETKDPFICRKSYLGDDKNKYLSLLELNTGNYLNELKLSNEILDYKYEHPVCSDKLWTCDFFITKNDGNKIWLETDGMRSNRNIPYDSGNNEKINYYIANGLNYYIISYKDNISNFINLMLGINKIIIGGKEFNYGEINNDYIFFTKEEIYNYHTKYGEDWVLSNLVIPFYKFLQQYISTNGWIYPNYEFDFNILKQHSGKLNSSSRVGVQFMKSHFKSFWEASNNKNKSPIEIINDEKLMIYYLKYRFGISNSKLYQYSFNNKIVMFNELFDISFKQVRKSLEVNRVVVSLFKPMVAKFIYQKYGFNGMKTWDPCGGFGGRMLGFYGSFNSGTYVCNEPNSKTFKELGALAEKLDISVQLYNKPIEDISPPNNIDLVFTCPPYDFKEHYCDEENQSDMKYNNYTYWVEGFLKELMKKSYKSINKNGRVIMVFDEKNSNQCIKIASQIGLRLIEKLVIHNQQTHLNHVSNREFCLVFQK